MTPGSKDDHKDPRQQVVNCRLTTAETLKVRNSQSCVSFHSAKSAGSSLFGKMMPWCCQHLADIGSTKKNIIIYEGKQSHIFPCGGIAFDLPHSTYSGMFQYSLYSYSMEPIDRGHKALGGPSWRGAVSVPGICSFQWLGSSLLPQYFLPIGACYHTNNVTKFWMTQKNMGGKWVVSQEKQVAHIEQFDRKPTLPRIAVKIITGITSGKDEKGFVHNPRRILSSDCFMCV